MDWEIWLISPLRPRVINNVEPGGVKREALPNLGIYTRRFRPWDRRKEINKSASLVSREQWRACRAEEGDRRTRVAFRITTRPRREAGASSCPKTKAIFAGGRLIGENGDFVRSYWAVLASATARTRSIKR